MIRKNLMFAYASRTGTRRNLSALRAAGWGLMVSARGVHRTEGFDRYCIDNGAWTSFTQGQQFDEAAFLKVYELLAANSDFVVLPDIVAGGHGSLEFSLAWRQRLPFVCPQLLAVQDGMTSDEVASLIGPRLGIFVGGTSQWKEQTMRNWGQLARARDAYCHVGRVNSARRIALCAAAAVDSFDGSSVSRFAVTLQKLDNALRQPDMLIDV
ncbi:MAG TPA: hypothetical protein VKD24_03485 [Candidatus Angelobacter sp.]|nr:hypothetical protein [Candidatus Angelobacter sp.]